ncbi:hypothetical protein D3C87_2193280 [compost metagenome]
MKWNEAHDKAYFKELERALGIRLTRKFARADLNKHFRDYMETPEVQAKIREYRLGLEREHQLTDTERK